MIWFILFFILAFGLALYQMRRQRKPAKEIAVFCTIASIGFVCWIFVFLERPLKPNHWIAWVIDRLGL
ncbi:hypothetical protein ACFFNY_30780 [Paenibacillus hodogayensis]|uniref:Uncharacterized protein n=1 Tax=Paenibacillus hodogayensis TaxID=279208 RepID=A0ABV5W5Y7_9BACL